MELGGDALLDGGGAEGWGEDVPCVGLDFEMGLRQGWDAREEIAGEEGSGGMERTGAGKMEGDVEVDADLGGADGGEGGQGLGKIGPA